MILHIDFDPIAIRQMIRAGAVTLGGNKQLKIYGLLSCASGKRMKAGNRVFFRNAQEAASYGYRPCGHCLREQYKTWKLHG
ncbi:metal-binding protein [Chitinophaga sp. Mgbs1]|uniref:Metal-binding protein n=1 Tax=Chitinophaga solisilvae TaxID=1233460 RepID=A0A3S1B2U8_9BACT|nr:metal-binding protein [Chitinophaga solisilvae]